MNCENLKALLAAEIYGDNTPDESRALKAHLSGCGQCRTIQADWQQAAAHAAPAALPKDDAYWIRQKASIMERLPKQGHAGSQAWHRLAGPVLALGLLVSAWGWHREKERMDLRIAQNMDLLQDMDMLQQLDIVKDLDVVEKR